MAIHKSESLSEHVTYPVHTFRNQCSCFGKSAMGFLTEVERVQLRIESMILHVVSNDDFDPAPAQVVQYAGFFLSRILDTDVAPVYQFRDVSRSRDWVEQMAQSTVTFEHGAQELSREFSRGHGTTTRDGAFFIFELHMALLHKSEGRRDYPSPRRSYAMAPTGTVLGRPSCVKRLSRATRTCNSTTCRSNVRAITRWPRRLKQCILVSTRLLR